MTLGDQLGQLTDDRLGRLDRARLAVEGEDVAAQEHGAVEMLLSASRIVSWVPASSAAVALSSSIWCLILSLV